MEYYKVITKQAGKPAKEDYFLNKDEASFLAGFNKAPNVTTEIVTLDTNQQAQN